MADSPSYSSVAREAYDSLSSLATLVKPQSTNRADFVRECRSGTLNGVRVVYRTFDSAGVTGRIDEEIAAVLGKEGLGARFLCHNGKWLVHCRALEFGGRFCGVIQGFV